MPPSHGGGYDPARDQAGHWVWLARIRRPQGRKGEVFADILTDFPEKFADAAALAAARPGSPRHQPPPRAKSSFWPTGSIKAASSFTSPAVDSISAAETLAGLIVAIPRAERAPLAEDEVYIADLIGCTLYDVAKIDAPSASARSKA